MYRWKKCIVMVLVILTRYFPSYALVDCRPIDERDPLPARCLRHPFSLNFMPRITTQEDYNRAILSTPLIHYAPLAKPPRVLTEDMFVPQGLCLLSSFIECNFESVKLDLSILDFKNFSKSTFLNTRTQFTRFIGANLTEVTFDNIQMDAADFFGAIGKKIKIENSRFIRSRFDSMDFTEASVQDTLFEDCTFLNCTMSPALEAFLKTQKKITISEPIYTDA